MSVVLTAYKGYNNPKQEKVSSIDLIHSSAILICYGDGSESVRDRLSAYFLTI